MSKPDAASGQRKLYCPWQRSLLCSVFAAHFILASSAFSGEKIGAHYIKPGPRDKCPVCGMFVSKYPDWTAEVVFRDNMYRVFDGAKDLFRYIADMKTYEPSKTRQDIAALFVTDYYTVRRIDGFKAFYVLDSDVSGPMGDEFIPFEKEADALEFLKDHQGRRLLQYRDITREVLAEFE